MTAAGPSQANDPTAVANLAEILASPGGGRKKWGGTWKWLAAALALAAIAAFGYWQFSGRAGTYVYSVQKAKRGDLAVIVTATGSVQPTESVDISSELSGTVRKVNIEYNSVVKAGDVLAELDTNTLEATVQSARAKLNAAKANVAKAEASVVSTKATLDRKSELTDRRISSQQDLDDARFSYNSAVAEKASAEAQVLVAEADLRLAEVNLGRALIVSPIDGVILTRDVDPGATVAASLSAPVLFTLAGDLRKMELQVDIDEADVGQVAVGQKATFNVDAYPNATFPAEIQSIRFASETVNNVVTYKGVLSVDNGKLLLRPGMTATADIVVESISDGLLIPNAALRYSPPVVRERGGGSIFSMFRPPRMGALTAPAPSGSKRTVWVMRGGAAVAVPVEIGATDGQFTAVTSGDVKDGDELVTDATPTAS